MAGRFVKDRLEGLSDEPRPGAARTITDEQIESVIVKTLEEAPPNGDTHWSTRGMARVMGMSQTAISRIWRAFGLQPHLVDTWKLSTDPQFIEKVRDIVGLYLAPPMLPMMPGVPGRATHDYVRHGTTSLFAALDIATGKIIGQHQHQHRHQEFLRFLKTIDKNTPKDLDLHLICDNYATPQDPEVRKWLASHTPVPPAFHPHQRLLAQPRRTVVRRTGQPQTPPQHPSQRQRTRSRRRDLDRHLERGPETLRVDQNRRRDPEQPRQLLHTDT